MQSKFIKTPPPPPLKNVNGGGGAPELRFAYGWIDGFDENEK